MIIDFDLEYLLFAKNINAEGIKVKTMSGHLVHDLEIEKREQGLILTGITDYLGYSERFAWSVDGKLGMHPNKLDLCIDINPEKIL